MKINPEGSDFKGYICSQEKPLVTFMHVLIKQLFDVGYTFQEITATNSFHDIKSD